VTPAFFHSPVSFPLKVSSPPLSIVGIRFFLPFFENPLLFSAHRTLSNDERTECSVQSQFSRPVRHVCFPFPPPGTGVLGVTRQWQVVGRATRIALPRSSTYTFLSLKFFLGSLCLSHKRAVAVFSDANDCVTAGKEMSIHPVDLCYLVSVYLLVFPFLFVFSLFPDTRVAILSGADE